MLTEPKKIASNVTLYSTDPIIYVVSNFLSNEECQSFIDLGMGNMKRATVAGDTDEVVENRTNDFFWLEHNASEVVHEVSKRFSVLVKMPINNAEQFQLVYYGPEKEYKPHFDSFDKDTDAGKKNMEVGGQRMTTALAYLNDVEAGGATDFPEIGVSIKPNKGDVVIFNNCIQDTTDIHHKSLHGGSPVIAGEKWAVNLWFRENAIY